MSRRPKLPPEKLQEMASRRRAGVRLKVLARDYGMDANYIVKLVGPLHGKLSKAMRAAAERRRSHKGAKR